METRGGLGASVAVWGAWSGRKTGAAGSDAPEIPHSWGVRVPCPRAPGPGAGTAGQCLQLSQCPVPPSFSLPAWAGRPRPGTLPAPSRSVLSEPRTLLLPLNRSPSPTVGLAAAAGSRALLCKRLPDASAHSQPARSRTPPGLLASPRMKSKFCSRAHGRDRPRLPLYASSSQCPL